MQLAMGACAGLVSGCGEVQTTVPPSTPVAKPNGFVESDGLRIHYETFGQGDPIVLVHGWGSSLQGNWVDTGWVEALAAERRVVALDVRGHGDSDKPHDQAVYSYARMSRDVVRVMDHLGLAQADFLGYSMGSFMGASLLGQAHQRFTAMILGGIGDETDESLAVLPKIVAALRAEHPEQIMDPVGRAYRTYAGSDPRNDLEALALSALQMWPEGFPLQLTGPGSKDNPVPVLIVNGANDHPYIDTVPAVIAGIGNCQLAVIPDRDHLTVIRDPRFKERVLAFLAQRS
ncbi:MAG: alpha/beta fold hydrolase [Pirellulales bacterium]